jgi:hypothetical protein
MAAKGSSAIFGIGAFLKAKGWAVCFGFLEYPQFSFRVVWRHTDHKVRKSWVWKLRSEVIYSLPRFCGVIGFNYEADAGGSGSG